MYRYYFVALNKEKRKIKGYLEVTNVDELKKVLAFHELILIKSKKVKDKKKKLIENKLSKKDKINFYKNLEVLLNSNKNLILSLKLMKDISKNSLIKKFLDDAIEQLNYGNSLSSVMMNYKNIFSRFEVDLIEIAEKSNGLEQCFHHLKTYYEETNKIKNKLITSLIYPSILIILSIAVFFVLMVYIIPIYSNIFNENRIDTPIFTKIIFDLSSFIESNIIIIVIILLIIILLLFILLFSKKGKEVLINIIKRIPIIKNIFIKLDLYYLCSKFSIIMNSGMSFIDSLGILINSSSDSNEKRVLLWIKDEIKRGQSITEAFSSSKNFNKFFIEVIKCGENSGSMSIQFLYLSRLYLDELLAILNKVFILIEPISIIVISLFVGCIMLSIYMPMMDIFNSLY